MIQISTQIQGLNTVFCTQNNNIFESKQCCYETQNPETP